MRTGRTRTIPASCKSCPQASLGNGAKGQWSIWQVVLQVTCSTVSVDVLWRWWGLPGSCVPEVFVLSFAATEWELFLLTPQQRGREQGMLHMTAALSWWHEIHAQSCKQAKNSSVLSSFQDLNLCHVYRKAVSRDCCDWDGVASGGHILSAIECFTVLS